MIATQQITTQGVAVLNLRALGKPETPEAIKAEVERLNRANRLDCCRPGFLADLWKVTPC